MYSIQLLNTVEYFVFCMASSEVKNLVFSHVNCLCHLDKRNLYVFVLIFLQHR